MTRTNEEIARWAADAMCRYMEQVRGGYTTLYESPEQIILYALNKATAERDQEIAALKDERDILARTIRQAVEAAKRTS